MHLFVHWGGTLGRKLPFFLLLEKYYRNDHGEVIHTAIFKVVQTSSGGVAGYATPVSVEKYLKYKQDEDGNVLLDEYGNLCMRTSHISAQNARADFFSEDCRALSSVYDTCNKYDSLKYKHFVQGFAPEDSSLMSEEQCHALGVELAKTLWAEFPVLVVTHTDRVSDGADKCRWHNHFIVYNCSTAGRKLCDDRATLRSQKRYVISQAQAHGLTQAGLVMENGRIRESTREYSEDIHQNKLERRLNNKNELTRKAELRLAVKTAMAAVGSYEEYGHYLQDIYGVKTRIRNGELYYMHPESEHKKWISSTKLGKYTQMEAVISGINESNNRREHSLGARTSYSDRGLSDEYRRGHQTEYARIDLGQDTGGFRRIQEMYDELFKDADEPVRGAEGADKTARREDRAASHLGSKPHRMHGEDTERASEGVHGNDGIGGKHI